MIVRTLARSGLAALVLGSSALVLTGCGAADDGAASSNVGKLTSQLQEQRRLNEALQQRIDRLERRVDGHTQDLDRLSRRSVDAALASADVVRPADGDESAAAADSVVPVSPAAIATLLETEEGQAAVERAMAAVQERRDTERRERWAAAMVDRFASEANLTQAQSQDVRRIVTDSFKKAGDVWSGLQSADLSDDQRAIQREEAMVKMEEIRQQTNDEVKAVLSSDQYAIYEEMAGRMRGWGGGGPAGGGRRGR